MTKILVIGAGAIGTFYASKLWQVGCDITLWQRQQHNPINIKSKLGDFIFYPQQIISDLTQYQQQADYILVATKVLPNINLPQLLLPVVSKNSKIVLIQNGINIENKIAKSFIDNEIISVIAFVCVARLANGDIDHQDNGDLIMGNYQKPNSIATNFLAELFRKANIPAKVSKNIQVDRWEKLVWNAAFNPLSVLTGGLNTAQMLANPACRNLIANIMQEVVDLSIADDCSLPAEIIAQKIAYTEKMVPYQTSMLLDFYNNRPLEIEAILGNALDFARQKAVSTPYLSTIYALLSCFANR